MNIHEDLPEQYNASATLTPCIWLTKDHDGQAPVTSAS